MTGCRSLGGSTVGTAFKLPAIKKITTTSSYTTPADIDYIEVFVIGGGGSGAGGSALYGGGTGGGGGGVESGFFPSGTYAITVGTAASGGAAGADGVDGSSTTFGTLTALGGKKGVCPTSTGHYRGGSGAVINSDGFYGRGCGSHGNIDQGGTGGVSYFGLAGRAAFSVTGGATGFTGSDGGGGSGAGGTADGRAAGAGSVIIIEHFI
jgi:hypothetical protein